jgi:hypothetical protein
MHACTTFASGSAHVVPFDVRRASADGKVELDRQMLPLRARRVNHSSARRTFNPEDRERWIDNT